VLAEKASMLRFTGILYNKGDMCCFLNKSVAKMSDQCVVLVPAADLLHAARPETNLQHPLGNPDAVLRGSSCNILYF
jgi:hypothetical protein